MAINMMLMAIMLVIVIAVLIFLYTKFFATAPAQGSSFYDAVVDLVMIG